MLVKMITYKCGPETGTCQDLKIELEVELHQTKESIEQAELRLKQVESESKKKEDQLQELKCKVKGDVFFKQTKTLNNTRTRKPALKRSIYEIVIPIFYFNY